MAGKKKNALKHGAYAREDLLFGEKPAEFDALRRGLIEEWVPEGATEQNLVDRLAGLIWKQQRMERYDQAMLKRGVESVRIDTQTGIYLQTLIDLIPKFKAASSAAEVEEILLSLDPSYVDVALQRAPRDKVVDPTKWGAAIASGIRVIRRYPRNEGYRELTAALNPATFDAELLRSERIADAIDRAIRRLMQVKAAKEVFVGMKKASMKVINPPNDPQARLAG